jgi:hypothetical protein
MHIDLIVLNKMLFGKYGRAIFIDGACCEVNWI